MGKWCIKQNMLVFVYYGHSTFSLKNARYRLLFDPFFSCNPMADIKADVIPCNHLLVSHGHGDHMIDAAAIAERTKAVVIGTPEVLEACKATNAHSMNIGGSAELDFGSVYMTQAVHSSGLPGGLACGFVVQIADKTVYYSGDTALFSDMKLISERFDIDLAVLPIGGNYTMDIYDAAKAVEWLKPKHVIPVHYNTWPVIQADPEKFKELVESKTDAQVHILKSGDFLDLEKLS